MYEITFDKQAIEFLNRLPTGMKERIYHKIIIAKTNPHHFFERLKERKCYKLRVGDYRVIADINERKIEIRLIGHRKNVYEPRNFKSLYTLIP